MNKHILSINKIKDLIASNGPLISRRINKQRLKRDKTEYINSNLNSR
jgi:hypothetical protein